MEALSIYLPSAARSLPSLSFCLLAKIECLFLSLLSSESSHRAQRCLQIGCLSQISLYTRPMISLLRVFAHFRLALCYLSSERHAFAVSFSPNQVQSDCADPELDCFQVLCTFSLLIFKNFFSIFSGFQRKSGARCLDSAIRMKTLLWPRNNTGPISSKIGFHK